MDNFTFTFTSWSLFLAFDKFIDRYVELHVFSVVHSHRSMLGAVRSQNNKYFQHFKGISFCPSHTFSSNIDGGPFLDGQSSEIMAVTLKLILKFTIQYSYISTVMTS
jgi:hypothetical protein